jgi:hypothetical protein
MRLLSHMERDLKQMGRTSAVLFIGILEAAYAHYRQHLNNTYCFFSLSLQGTKSGHVSLCTGKFYTGHIFVEDLLSTE